LADFLRHVFTTQTNEWRRKTQSMFAPVNDGYLLNEENSFPHITHIQKQPVFQLDFC